jgi:hypothetical protein
MIRVACATAAWDPARDLRSALLEVALVEQVQRPLRAHRLSRTTGGPPYMNPASTVIRAFLQSEAVDNLPPLKGTTERELKPTDRAPMELSRPYRLRLLLLSGTN